jgi:alkylhydroperoxidase/carboxymuconolactone decarboxylase family protein YurZ
MRGRSIVHYAQRLQRFAINDRSLAEPEVEAAIIDNLTLEPKTLELVRLAALVAVGGAVPSYGAQVDAAVSAGATAEEIVDVLVGVVAVVGLPCVVEAAPKLAMALGYDVHDDLDRVDSR